MHTHVNRQVLPGQASGGRVRRSGLVGHKKDLCVGKVFSSLFTSLPTLSNLFLMIFNDILILDISFSWILILSAPLPLGISFLWRAVFWCFLHISIISNTWALAMWTIVGYHSQKYSRIPHQHWKSIFFTSTVLGCPRRALTNVEVSIAMGVPPKWLAYDWKSIYKWMITGY